MRLTVAMTGSLGVVGMGSYLARARLQDDVDLRVLMSGSAARFVSPAAIGAIVGRPVVCGWELGATLLSGADVARETDVLTLAPATARTIADCATGCAASLTAATYLACEGPVIVAPVMAPAMLGHPAVARNLRQLVEDGAQVLPTGDGLCAATGQVEGGAMCPFDMWWSAIAAAASGVVEAEA